MEAKDVLYAAVGAPVVAARKVGDRVAGWRERMGEESSSYGKAAERAIEGWATEGKKVIDQIGDGNVVEEISSKVDLDQAKQQVVKLRDQLEDMLDTWRASFRPEKAETMPAKQPAKPAAEQSANKKPAAKPASAKTPAPKKQPANRASAKKPAAKTASAKKPAAKSASTEKTPKSA